jgi:hypothetical protein
VVGSVVALDGNDLVIISERLSEVLEGRAEGASGPEIFRMRQHHDS